MSAIASFYLLDRQDLPGVVQAVTADEESTLAGTALPDGALSPPVYRSIRQHGRELDDLYLWSGYSLMHVFSYLAESGIPLDHSEYDAEAQLINGSYDLTYLITPAHKAYLSQLEPQRHDEHVLRQYLERHSAGLAEAGMAAMDGLAVLHDQISALTDQDILLVHIG